MTVDNTLLMPFPHQVRNEVTRHLLRKEVPHQVRNEGRNEGGTSDVKLLMLNLSDLM